MDTDQKLSDIHDKINGVAIDVAKISGILETALPQMVTEDSVKVLIAEHDSGCRRSMAMRRPPNRRKQAVIGTGVLAAVSGLIYAIAQFVPLFQ